jgi:3-dehydroquinate synthase
MSTRGESAREGVEKVPVELGDRSYDILIGEGLIGRAGELIGPLLARPRALIVTDSNVAEVHLPVLERALAESEIAFDAFVLPPGEHTKDFSHLEQLTQRLLQAGLDRRSMLIALGGGVIGDLAGFAAAVLLRGIDFIQIPTTLLAQVDSSVGGKTAIDMPQGKNLVGAFHQPRLVLADTATLATLPRRQRLAGYAETVKYGLLGDLEFFHWLETHGTAVVECDAAAVRHAVATACRAKAAIVARDETEHGERALLNLGHTFGHALEIELGYSDELLHGEAVALGMTLAFELSAQLGVCAAAESDRVRRHLGAMGLPTGFADLGGRVFDPARLVSHMRRDKKAEAGQLVFILARAIGEAFVARDVEAAEVERLLTESLAETLPPAGSLAGL